MAKEEKYKYERKVVGISADVLSNAGGCHLQDFQVGQNVQCATLEYSDSIILQESKKVKLYQPF